MRYLALASDYDGTLAHDGAVPFGNCELPLKRPRVYGDRSLTIEKSGELGPRLFIHCRPVEVGTSNLKSALCGRLDGLGLVDLIRNEVALSDSVLEFVTESRLIDLEEAQRVANE